MCAHLFQLLGWLGNRAHYRCRYCGLDYSDKGDLAEAQTEEAERLAWDDEAKTQQWEND